MKNHLIILICLLFNIAVGFSQNLKGNVFEMHNGEHKMPIPGANVYWLNADKGTVTEADGTFEIAAPDTFPATLIVSFVGYQADSTVLKSIPNKPLNIELKSHVDLKEFEVVGTVDHYQLLYCKSFIGRKIK